MNDGFNIRRAARPVAQRWKRSVRAMWIALMGFLVAGFAVPLLGPFLFKGTFLGFPLPYLLAAQGSLFAFIVIAVWFSRRQEAIDRDFGAAEDDF